MINNGTNKGILIYFTLLSLFIFMSCASGVKQSHQSVAVWDFDDLSPSGSAQSDLGELISIEVIKTFQDSGRYSVIERERLHLALAELDIGTTSLADESTRLELGKLSSAQLMVFGSYQVIGNSMRLDLRIIEVESGRVLKAVKKVVSSDNIAGWLENAKLAAEELL